MSVKQLSRVRWSKASVEAGVTALKDDTKGPNYLNKYGREKYAVKDGRLYYSDKLIVVDEKEKTEIVVKIFDDERAPSGIVKMGYYLADHFIGISNAFMRKVVKQTRTYQLKKPVLMNTGRSFIIPKRGEASIDLIFYKPKKMNNGFIGVYNCIMNLTKLAHGVPIKNKTALECERALKQCVAFFKKHGVTITMIFSDFAAEWKGEHMKLMKDNNIKQHHYAGLSSAPFIESF
jgi:hypothetical protein